MRCVVGILTGTLLKDNQIGIPQSPQDQTLEANIDSVRRLLEALA